MSGAGNQARSPEEKKMTKAVLIDKLHSAHDGVLTKKLVGELVDGVFQTLALTIRKEKRFTYPGFGTWSVRNRKKRMGRNPQTGAVITIKPSKTVGFKPAKNLKETL